MAGRSNITVMSLIRDGMRKDKELFDATQRWHLEMANGESFGDLCKVTMRDKTQAFKIL